MSRFETHYARLVYSRDVSAHNEPIARVPTSRVLPLTSDLTRIDVRPDLGTSHLSVDGSLAVDHPLGRHAAAVQPHREPRLSNTFSCLPGQPLSEPHLPASSIEQFRDSIGKGGFGHDDSLGACHTRATFNTVSVIAVNTRSVFRRGQTDHMPRNGETSAFWQRLKLARESCSPPKSMLQKDVLKDYKVSQAAVTKWKTGKSMPEPDTVANMARNTNVNVNWLWANQGDMRPLPATDPIVRQVVDALNALATPELKLQVLRFAISQYALESTPEAAARLAEAERLVKAQQQEQQRALRHLRAARSANR